MTAHASPIGASDRATRWDPGFLATLLRSDRLTLVFSPAGADRDAMLQRTLIPMLGRRAIDRPLADAAAQTDVRPVTERRHRRRDSQRGAEVVIRFDGWGPQPLQALRAQIAAVLPPSPDEAPAPTLATMLAAAARRHDVRLLLVFDGFERHLAASPADFIEVRQFDHQLLDWLRLPESPARVLFVVDDASQERMLRRYGESMHQFGRGWLRIRPQARTMSGPATIPGSARQPAPAPVAPAMRTPADVEADEISRFVRNLDLDGPVEATVAAEGAVASITADVADGSEPVIRADPDKPFIAEPPLLHHRPAASPQRRMPTLVGAAIGVLLGLGLGAAAWFLWLHDADATTAARTSAEPSLPVAATAPVAARDDAAPRPAPPPPAAGPRPVLPTAQPLALEVALSPDSGRAGVLLDELARQVGAPDGVSLSAAPHAGPTTVALLRADALPAAREGGSSAAPRVLLPLFREQVQVLARADGRWRFLHQLKGAHLNVGDAGGARSRTANALYRRLFGGSLPSWDVDRRDEASALRELLREGSALDAVFVVSDRPALEQMHAAQRAQLRVLVLDPQHPSTADVMRGFAVPAEPAGRAPLPQVTSYLVADAAGATPALQALGCALARAQPELQQRGSTLLRGIDARSPPPAGWTSLLAPDAAGCPPR